MGKAQKSGVDEGPTPTGLQALYHAMRKIHDSAGAAIDAPEAVTRMVVLDALMMFARLTGKPPRLIYITPALEAVLQIDRGRNLGQPEKTHGKLRNLELIFTCRPVWDAKEFRVE